MISKNLIIVLLVCVSYVLTVPVSETNTKLKGSAKPELLASYGKSDSNYSQKNGASKQDAKETDEYNNYENSSSGRKNSNYMTEGQSYKNSQKYDQNMDNDEGNEDDGYNTDKGYSSGRKTSKYMRVKPKYTEEYEDSEDQERAYEDDSDDDYSRDSKPKTYRNPSKYQTNSKYSESADERRMGESEERIRFTYNSEETEESEDSAESNNGYPY